MEPSALVSSAYIFFLGAEEHSFEGTGRRFQSVLVADSCAGGACHRKNKSGLILVSALKIAFAASINVGRTIFLAAFIVHEQFTKVDP